MEERIVEESRRLIRTLNNTHSNPIDNKLPLSTTVANVIAIVLSGTRYEETDPVFQQYLAHVSDTFHVTADRVILDVWPWMRYFPVIRTTDSNIRARQRAIRDFLKKIVDDHEANFVPGQNKDLLDAYLSAIQLNQHKTFGAIEAPLILEDLFDAGYETTTTTLRWGFLMMCLNPAIQEKVQKELDNVVGSDVIPRPSDKYNLPYFDAILQEIHRYRSIVPTGVDHCAAEDTTLDSYHISKGTWITSNLRFIHHNDQWWDRPETFDPSRFLGPEGERRAAEYLMPFSVGQYEGKCLKWAAA